MNTNPQNYSEFWDFYVSEHSLPLTRVLHFAGTSLGLILLAYFVYTARWYFFPLFFVVGYAFAWFAHFVVEKNKPASFRYPAWSFVSDFRMMWYMATGRMRDEVERVLHARNRHFS
ncbi:MAG: DUF962 domain-containing protein [Acidobacteriota bacterium]